MLKLEDFRFLVSDDVLAEIYRRARRLYGRHVVHVNSTYQGGGVAELLYPLVRLMNDVGVETGWRILHGSADFFEITKEFHNALQGAPLELTEAKKRTYCQVNENFSQFTHFDHDCVIVHDPQPLPLIRYYRKRQPWWWRCHIDLTQPHEELWDFLKGFLLKYDGVTVSSVDYVKEDLPVDKRIICPAINPLSPKNCSLPETTMRDALERAGMPTDKPFITQVSRLDPWKDPEGVLEVFERVKQEVDCRLVFCYNLASDDPEGMKVHNEVTRKAKKLIESGDVYFVVGNSETLVNSVQSMAEVVVQKSTREGFCLAVTEALWKGTPVVASKVGGIPAQIEDGVNGYLLEPKDYDGFSQRIVSLMKDPKERAAIGKNARETVRQKFLITRLLADYLGMLSDVFAKS